MKLILLITLTFFSINLLMAQTPDEEVKGAILTFENTEIDLGDIPEGIKKEFTVKFTNTGSDTLIISKVRAGCGCTAALSSEEVIKPSGSGEIKIVFNTAGRKGKQRKDVTIISNDSVTPRKQIVFTGNVVKAETDKKM